MVFQFFFNNENIFFYLNYLNLDIYYVKHIIYKEIINLLFSKNNCISQ